MLNSCVPTVNTTIECLVSNLCSSSSCSCRAKDGGHFLVSLPTLSNQDRELHKEAFLSACECAVYWHWWHRDCYQFQRYRLQLAQPNMPNNETYLENKRKRRGKRAASNERRELCSRGGVETRERISDCKTDRKLAETTTALTADLSEWDEISTRFNMCFEILICYLFSPTERKYIFNSQKQHWKHLDPGEIKCSQTAAMAALLSSRKCFQFWVLHFHPVKFRASKHGMDK